ncbi:MAG: hypothetical protein BWX83_01084 [Candidatus Cloacimonetes bacterium ADurb.Bin117]|nr:MAG: hypothetical protein BWX83_01084 [Candidatus Cloacimonetes bacterium ADurb.Bin117]
MHGSAGKALSGGENSLVYPDAVHPLSSIFGQQSGMDVQHRDSGLVKKSGREQSHETGQSDQVDLFLLTKLQQSVFKRLLIARIEYMAGQSQIRAELHDRSFAARSSGKGYLQRQAVLGKSLVQRPQIGAAAVSAGKDRYSPGFRCSSFHWISGTSEGAPLMRSAAFRVLGKAITSRMDSAPVMIITKRSIPGAMPP